MLKLAGSDCVICREPISSILEGMLCAGCGCPVHNRCIRANPTRSDACSVCGAEAQVVLAHQGRHQAETPAYDVELRWGAGETYIGSGLIWLFGGLAFSAATIAVTAAWGRILLVAAAAIGCGAGQIIYGICLLSRTESRAVICRGLARPFVAAALWVVALNIVVVPGGILTQIWGLDSRFNDRVAASPIRKICYICSGPAVTRKQYDDGTTIYFCEKHRPTDVMDRPTDDKEHGGKDFNPWFCIVLVVGIVGVNCVRAIISPFTSFRFFRVSIPGAIIGVIMAAIAWNWFHGRLQ